MKIGLVLSGGGIRAAHIGVTKALEDVGYIQQILLEQVLEPLWEPYTHMVVRTMKWYLFLEKKDTRL